MKKTVAFLVSIVLALSLAACSSTPANNESVEPPTAEHTTDAYTLSDLYENNEEEAEASITGKVVEITGKVDKVSGNTVYLDRESTMGYIVCTMSEHSADYSALEKGDEAVIVGAVEGETGHIKVSDCFYIEG